MTEPEPPVPIPQIVALEERAFNAWPARETRLTDGWLLRFSRGYTKRANSINAWRPAGPLQNVLPAAQALYAARALPTIVRLTPLAPPATDAWLASIGYQQIDVSLVMTVDLATPTPIAPSADRAAPHEKFTADPAVHLAPAPSPEWLGGCADANRVPPAQRAIHDAMVRALAPPAAFASLDVDGQSMAWGIAVVERGMVGLFDIVTVPAARGRGFARRLVTTLLAWASAEHATTAYLQVVATNTPAIHLYTSLGFRESYRYHYRIAPDPNRDK